MLSVQIAFVVRNKNLNVLHYRVCHGSRNTIVQSRNVVKRCLKICPRIRDVCECCQPEKSTRQPRHPVKESSIKSPLYGVFSQIVVLVSLPSFGGANYFITLLDEYSAYSIVRFVAQKYLAGEADIDMIEKFGEQVQSKCLVTFYDVREVTQMVQMSWWRGVPWETFTALD